MNKDTTTAFKIQDVKSYAEAYIQQGWNVLPLKYGTKGGHVLKGWKEYQTKKQTIAFLEDPVWNNEIRNIAVICGKISNNLVVIDCDSQSTVELFEELCPEFVNTYKVKTRRGVHFYFKVDGLDELKSLKFIATTKDGEKLEIDVQADGKYVIAPPSYFNKMIDDMVGKKKKKNNDEEESKENEIIIEHIYTELTDISTLKTITAEQYRNMISKIKSAFDKETLKQMLPKDEEGGEQKQIAAEEEQENAFIIDKERFKELVISHYVEGVRHYLVLYGSGFLRKSGFKYEDTVQFWEEVWEHVQDEEKEKRYTDIRTTYESDISTVAGYTKLVEFIPEIDQCIRAERSIPYPFELDKGILIESKFTGKGWKKERLCPFFFVKDRVINITDGTNIGYILKFIESKKEVFVSVDDLNRQKLAKVISKHIDALDENTATKVLKYITQYTMINKQFIKHKYAVDTIGWVRGDYYLPQLKPDHYFLNLASGYGANGGKSKEIELFEFLISEKSYLALGYVIAVSGILLPLLHIDNFVIYAGGRTGAGKSTMSFLALSMFGNYEALKATNNNATVGFELFLKQRNHTLAVLDELNTAVGDTEKVAKNLMNNIYQFASGIGRNRATKNIELREQVRWEGVLYISAEDDLKTFLKLNRQTVKGAYRRTIMVDFERLYGKYDGEKNLQRWSELIYSTIKENYGNMLEDIVKYIKDNIDDIKKDYEGFKTYFADKDRWQFNGQERALALLATATKVFEKITQDSSNSFQFLYELIDEVADYNNEIFNRSVRTSKEDLLDEIETWISENYGCFKITQTKEEEVVKVDGNEKRKEKKLIESTEKQANKSLYGKIEDEKLLLTSLGLTSLAKYLQISENELKKLLVDFGIAEKDEVRIIKRSSTRIDGAKLNVYVLKYAYEGENIGDIYDFTKDDNSSEDDNYYNGNAEEDDIPF